MQHLSGLCRHQKAKHQNPEANYSTQNSRHDLPPLNRRIKWTGDHYRFRGAYYYIENEDALCRGELPGSGEVKLF